MRGRDFLKTTVKAMDYDAVMALPRPEHRDPIKPNLFWRTLVRAVSGLGMGGCKLDYTIEGLDTIGRDEPCLILMNHSCFADMCIAHRLLYPRPFNIVCTNDGFIGLWGLLGWAMRQIGCFPTQKFVTDLKLVQDMQHCFKMGSSVLMYPEASYSFDGTATPLPRKLGVLLKKFGVPVIMIETRELFLRNPLYNELQIRKGANAKVRAYVLFSREDIQKKTVQELSDGIDAAFDFDHFRWQKEHGLEIHDSFRADGLHRILYKCAHCGTEGKMEGKGTLLTCHHCGKQYELTPLGELQATQGQTEIPHIPDYYRWEREQVKQEILDGTYRTETDVSIAMQVDYKAIYMVGRGHLTHDRNGFTLTGCDGKLCYTQKPQTCYSLYSDYYWYEIGDCVCIGDNEVHYFCFPKDAGIPVAKYRLATEEMYKLYKKKLLKSDLTAIGAHNLP